MSVLLDEVCNPWPVDMSCCAGWLDVSDGTPEQNLRLEQQEAAVRWATAVLWKRTRRRYGVCPRTVYICPPCGCRCDPCKCGPKSLLRLVDDVPVQSITSITQMCSGEVILPARYELIDSRFAALVSSEQCGWTTGALDCELQVIMEVGYTPDAEAIGAVSELACERMLQCTGGVCRLNKLATDFGAYKRGNGGRRDVMLTGLPTVDQFIISSTSTSPAWMWDPAQPFPYVKG